MIFGFYRTGLVFQQKLATARCTRTAIFERQVEIYKVIRANAIFVAMYRAASNFHVKSKRYLCAMYRAASIFHAHSGFSIRCDKAQSFKKSNSRNS